MKFKVFIDGAEGTTGLKIYEYFKGREDIDVLNIAQDRRKDPDARLSMMKKADITFLCLPDSAAEEIAAAAPGDVRLIDTSTVHRVSEDWTYGLAELDAAKLVRDDYIIYIQTKRLQLVSLPFRSSIGNNANFDVFFFQLCY